MIEGRALITWQAWLITISVTSSLQKDGMQATFVSQSSSYTLYQSIAQKATRGANALEIESNWSQGHDVSSSIQTLV